MKPSGPRLAAFVTRRTPYFATVVKAWRRYTEALPESLRATARLVNVEGPLAHLAAISYGFAELLRVEDPAALAGARDGWLLMVVHACLLDARLDGDQNERAMREGELLANL